ncbi:nucleoside recognition domain-containing protein [Riemerella columbipharyngis]|uniref:Spore maturation protein SpmA n=1 Tax=Riemerella columbipharyngis TaxID=1071918 RepID=A0A1G7F454_9FLAO|nr:nucleoside recognition domain-containing protein [Riemerella columbipharyngis]SDE70694.1 Spore maturation protein SpmA [Riemerella columbipharyngis]
MALSRFWGILFLSSILFLFVDFFVLRSTYSLANLISGEKGDKLLVQESYLKDLPPTITYPLKQNKNSKDSVEIDGKTYVLQGDIVHIYQGEMKSDGLLPTAKSSLVDLIIPMMAYLAFFCGLMQLLIDSGTSERLAKFISPLFSQIFPSIPKNHESISYMTLNFTANFLGLDSAATPFGLKAMESLQTLNKTPDKASDAQIMFMCLHAAGLTLLPTSIIGYRAAEHASNPADVMIPCIITSFIGTLAALIIVGIRQRINFFRAILIASIFTIVSAIIGLMLYINSLDLLSKYYFTNNLSSVMLLAIIGIILFLAFIHEKKFIEKDTTIFDSFVKGAVHGFETGVKIFPYVLGILMAISLFRNSGLFEIISNGLASFFKLFGLSKSITDALPVALLRPFSSGGSRGFMIDSMRMYGADSFTGRLVSIFQCSSETTFYVIAVYFGAVNIKNVRYTLSTMLLVDLICVITGILVAQWFF